MNNKFILESLAMDLKRVAIGYHRDSEKMTERFKTESFSSKNEVDLSTVKPYMKNILNNLENELNSKNKVDVAEKSLMYSTLVQNYCTHSLT